MKRTLALQVVIALIGCGGRTSSDSADASLTVDACPSGEVGAADERSAFIAAMCDLHMRSGCCERAVGLGLLSNDRHCRDYYAGFADVPFDPVAARECLAGVQAAACTASLCTPRGDVPRCVDVFPTPTVERALGEPCDVHTVCRDSGCFRGVCTAYVPLGTDCATGPCPPGASCAITWEGRAPECAILLADGMACGANEQCESHACTGGKCQPRNVAAWIPQLCLCCD